MYSVVYFFSLKKYINVFPTWWEIRYDEKLKEQLPSIILILNKLLSF